MCRHWPDQVSRTQSRFTGPVVCVCSPMMRERKSRRRDTVIHHSESGQSVRVRRLSARLGRVRNAGEHEPQGQLLRQRGGGEFLFHARVRVLWWPHHSLASAARHLSSPRRVSGNRYLTRPSRAPRFLRLLPRSHALDPTPSCLSLQM